MNEKEEKNGQEGEMNMHDMHSWRHKGMCNSRFCRHSMLRVFFAVIIALILMTIGFKLGELHARFRGNGMFSPRRHMFMMRGFGSDQGGYYGNSPYPAGPGMMYQGQVNGTIQATTTVR